MNILMNIEIAAFIFIIIVVVFSCHINYFVFNCNIQLFTRLLKLQSVSFASLSPSLFENLELQIFAELFSLPGVESARLQRGLI